ncbi:hypothetical protein L7F22_037003 [Adiantum nelumboides]|nr:hypothetical protein [Adiantum nelumboides]
MQSSNFVHSVGMASIGVVRQMSPSAFKKADLTETDLHDYLSSEMGERRYQRLEESESLKLANLYIRRNILGRGEDAGRGLVNHDAAVVELKDGQQGTLLHIEAEKAMAGQRADSRKTNGIFIEWKRDFRFRPDEDIKYDCCDCPIRLQQVLQVLKAPAHSYDLITSNCWQYAALIVRDLIKILRDGIEDSNNDVRVRLERELQMAETSLRNANNVVPRAVGKGSLVASVSSAATIVGAGSSNFVHSVGMASIGVVRQMSPSAFKKSDLTEMDLHDYLSSEIRERRYQRRGEAAGRGRVNHDAAVVELKDGQQGQED